MLHAVCRAPVLLPCRPSFLCPPFASRGHLTDTPSILPAHSTHSTPCCAHRPPQIDRMKNMIKTIFTPSETTTSPYRPFRKCSSPFCPGSRLPLLCLFLPPKSGAAACGFAAFLWGGRMRRAPAAGGRRKARFVDHYCCARVTPSYRRYASLREMRPRAH